jgi:hypothetical protein
MAPSDSLTFTCALSSTPLTTEETEKVTWPIVRRSDKRAVLLKIAGHEKWLRPGDFSTLRTSFAHLRPERLSSLLDYLSKLLATEKDSLVPVKLAGKGPTEKSHKYRVVVHEEHRGEFPRTFTLPVSQIIDREGASYAPLWLFTRHLQCGESVRGIWPGVGDVKREMEDAFSRLRERIEARRLAWEAGADERRRIEEIASKEREERNRRSRAEEAARAERQRKLAAKLRFPDRVEENCTVTFPKWETSGTSFRAENDVTITGCRVSYFGKKREIITPDGTKIVKLESPRLKIVPQPPG